MTSISWSDLIKNSAGSFDPLPNGDYDVVCVSAEAAQSSTGKAMIKAKFRVQGGPHDGRHVWDQYVISPENPRALSFFFRNMKMFGMDTDFFTQMPPVNPALGADDPSLQRIAATMVNRAVRFTLKQETWQGQVRNVVKDIKPSLASGGSVPAAGPQMPALGAPAGVPTPTPTPTPTPAPAPAPQPEPAAPQQAQPSTVAPPPEPPTELAF